VRPAQWVCQDTEIAIPDEISRTRWRIKPLKRLWEGLEKLLAKQQQKQRKTVKERGGGGEKGRDEVFRKEERNKKNGFPSSLSWPKKEKEKEKEKKKRKKRKSVCMRETKENGFRSPFLLILLSNGVVVRVWFELIRLEISLFIEWKELEKIFKLIY
jgi:hypothetical protein